MAADSMATMDIDNWACEVRPQSHPAMSYSTSGGQPPSIGDVRQIVISESASNQTYYDGQPPSVNDVGRREPSQSEASCSRYEGSEAHEVQQPRILEIGVEKKRIINSELWQLCAGPLVNLPAAGTHVVYFPQGHCQQVAASVKKDVDAQIPNYPNLQSNMLCILHNITLHADTETDEVYAQMTLQPAPLLGEEELLRSDLAVRAHKPQTEFYCKTLTESETSINMNGIFIPRQAAENVFPPLDFMMQEPAQELVARDLHGNVWTFRHIYHWKLESHLLTDGWNSFVKGKRLFAGDSVLFIRNKNQQLLLGVRRANRRAIHLSSALSGDTSHDGILAVAAHAAANNSPFTLFYNPRGSPSEFVIPLAKYYKAVSSNRIYHGMRFQMMFETEEPGTICYMGTIIGISDLDDVRWKNSQWRNLQVGWDDNTAGERNKRVSLWEIEPVSSPYLTRPPPGNQSNHPGQMMLGDESMDLGNLYNRTMPSGRHGEVCEDMPMKDPGLSIAQWMNTQQSNQIQPRHITPLVGSVLKNYRGADLSLQLGLSKSQMITQNNLQFNNQQLQKPQQPATTNPLATVMPPQQLIDLNQLKIARQNLISQTQDQLRLQSHNVLQHQSAIQNLQPQQQKQQMTSSQEVVQPRNGIWDPVAAIKMHYAAIKQCNIGREGKSWRSSHLNHPSGPDLKIVVNNVKL